MGEKDNVRQQAWLLSKLMQADDADLDAYRARYLEREDVALDDLRTLRACLLELSRALLVNLPERWKAVHGAADKLGAVAIDGDTTASLKSPSASAPLPFQAARPSPPLPASPLEPHAGFGSTAPIAPDATAGNAALPFDDADAEEPAVKVDTISLTLGHHAELTAARARDPNGWEAVLQRYGINDAATFSALDRAWQARFKQRPDLQRRWVAAYRRAQKTTHHDH